MPAQKRLCIGLFQALDQPKAAIRRLAESSLIQNSEMTVSRGAFCSARSGPSAQRGCFSCRSCSAKLSREGCPKSCSVTTATSTLDQANSCQFLGNFGDRARGNFSIRHDDQDGRTTVKKRIQVLAASQSEYQKHSAVYLRRYINGLRE